MRMTVNPTTILALKAFPQQLKDVFFSIPASYRNWAPDSWEGIPSESLTAASQICHVRDVEIDGYHVRIGRLLTETEPTLDSLDGYALVGERNYAVADPEAVLAEFSSARKKTLKIIGSLSPDELGRTGYFDGYGTVTVNGLIHYLCSHDQQHLSGLQWLLGKIESARSERVQGTKRRGSDGP